MPERPLKLQQVSVSVTPPRDGHGVNTGTIHPLAELYTMTLLSGPSGRDYGKVALIARVEKQHDRMPE